ncbi:MAG: SPOR domain-containing protein [Burkholderiaceae bacterium]|nr:SPOR domain-containing protein [Burkholderiaceae bacterium]
MAANADALRARVAARLPDATVRTVRRDARVHVLVGEAADRAAAQQLAQQLRTSLRQDVVLFRW